MSSLRAKISAVYLRALANGNVVFAPTTKRTVADSVTGLQFCVLIAPSLAKKPGGRASPLPTSAGAVAPARPNPFLPYDPALWVADILPGNTHVLLLNKFPVIADHVLVVTKGIIAGWYWLSLMVTIIAPDFMDQDEPMSLADVAATLVTLGAMDPADHALAFYNCGRESGSSQPHRHVQVFPNASPVPMDALIRSVPDHHLGMSVTTSMWNASIPDVQCKIDTIERLPFHHRLTRRRTDASESSDKEALELHAAYTGHLHALAAAIGFTPTTTGSVLPHNVLLTRDWMLVVPRSRSHSTTEPRIGLNAVAYAGSVLVTSEGAADGLVGRVGDVVCECAYPRV
ncbi:hypothetical protein BC828DRAFT_413026 [Blastocladiella britannica]|nr:hypothetical protein BC828DRAFT_413026 [Blastocladiella britannica]